MMAMVLTLFAACSSKSSSESLAQKVTDNQELSQADYSEMIAYVNDAVSAMEKVNPDDPAAVEEVKNKYPDLDLYMTKLSSPEADQALDESNKSALLQLGEKVKGAGEKVLDQLGVAAAAPSLVKSALGEAASDAVEGAKDAAKDAVEGVKDEAKGVVENAKDQAKDAAKGAVETAKGKVNDAADKAVNKANDAANKAVDKANDAANKAADKAKKGVSDALNKLK